MATGAKRQVRISKGKRCSEGRVSSEARFCKGTEEFYFLNQPGQADIQTDLFFDYQNNVKAYPVWQKWLRDNQPPLLVMWGKYDPSFTVAGAQAYKRDVPGAEVHILEAGHFALDEKACEVIALTDDFLTRQTKK
jgi:pimeloyl-ACP methyl ester carboxylesterase